MVLGLGPTKEVSTNKLSYRTEAEVIGQSPVRAVCRRERLTNRILFSTVLVILSAVPAYPELPGAGIAFFIPRLAAAVASRGE